MSHGSELVLLFDTNHMENVVDQLGKAFDKYSTAGDNLRTPTLMVVRKDIWLALEKEFATIRKSKGQTYEVASGDPTQPFPREGSRGYNALIFRGRPVVPIAPGDNIIADRVGAND